MKRGYFQKSLVLISRLPFVTYVSECVNFRACVNWKCIGGMYRGCCSND